MKTRPAYEDWMGERVFQIESKTNSKASKKESFGMFE